MPCRRLATPTSARATRAACRLRRRRDAAAVTLEAVLGIPLFLIVFFATFLFGMIMTVAQGVTHAAIEGAREAAQVNSTVASSDAVESAAVTQVNDILAIYGLTASGLNPDVQVIVEDSSGSAYAGQPIIAGPCGSNVPPAVLDCASTSIALTDVRRVRVRVLVEFSAIPIPDFLGYFGASVVGKRFDSRSDALRDL